MIARKAGVSIPTVYKYFPTGNDLIPACTGLVAARAPLALDERIFEGMSRVSERMRTLARSVFRLHEYFAPWLRWSDADAAAFPALLPFLERGRKARLYLVRRALTPAGTRPREESLVLLAHVFLEFPSWRTLTAAGNATDEAAALVAEAILTLFHSRRL
jgi:AcrR family transcriptional regulator